MARNGRNGEEFAEPATTTPPPAALEPSCAVAVPTPYAVEVHVQDPAKAEKLRGTLRGLLTVDDVPAPLDDKGRVLFATSAPEQQVAMTVQRLAMATAGLDSLRLAKRRPKGVNHVLPAEGIEAADTVAKAKVAAKHAERNPA
jgi:hypothetical protein